MFELFAAAWHHVAANPAPFVRALGVHISLSALALLIGAAIAIPLAVWLERRGGVVALAGINVANVGRTLPSLAVPPVGYVATA